MGYFTSGDMRASGGFMVLTTVLFHLGLLVVVSISESPEQFRHFMYGSSVGLSTLLIVYFLIRKNIIQYKTKLKVSLRLARLLIFLGLVSLVFCRTLFFEKNRMDNEIDGMNLINYIIPFVLIIPLSQELIFRNGIQELLGNTMNIHLAIAVTSILFASITYLPDFQLTVNEFFQYYFTSTILGYFYYYSGSVFITIAISSLYYLFIFIAYNV